MYARLTEEGREALCEARPTLIEGVRHRFLAHFDDAELDALADAWERVRPGATDHAWGETMFPPTSPLLQRCCSHESRWPLGRVNRPSAATG
jgi:hypothetical protein